MHTFYVGLAFVHAFQVVVVLRTPFTMALVFVGAIQVMVVFVLTFLDEFLFVHTFQVTAVFVRAFFFALCFVHNLQVIVCAHLFAMAFGFCANISGNCRFVHTFSDDFCFVCAHFSWLSFCALLLRCVFCAHIARGCLFCVHLFSWVLFLCSYFR